MRSARPAVGHVPAATAADPEELAAVLRRHHASRSLNPTEARVLADAIAGRLDPTRLSTPKQVALGRLRNAGLLSADDDISVTDDVAFSLML